MCYDLSVITGRVDYSGVAAAVPLFKAAIASGEPSHDGTLSVDDVGDFELVIPGPAKREPGIHIRRAPDKGTERRPSKIVVMDSGQPRSLSSGRPLRAGPVGGFRNDG